MYVVLGFITMWEPKRTVIYELVSLIVVYLQPFSISVTSIFPSPLAPYRYREVPSAPFLWHKLTNVFPSNVTSTNPLSTPSVVVTKVPSTSISPLSVNSFAPSVQ